MPGDEAASYGGWQVTGEPWDLLVPPLEWPLAQLSTWAIPFLITAKENSRNQTAELQLSIKFCLT